jgi:hypothetical protein
LELRNSNLVFLRCFLIISVLFFAGCQTVKIDSANTTKPAAVVSPVPAATKSELATTNVPTVDVPRLAGKTPEEFERIFGQAIEVKPLKEARADEFRVYRTPMHPKNLAVRFLRRRAINFALILSRKFPTAQAALREVFNIDVKDAPPRFETDQNLSEVWQGTFQGVRFQKIYAKRERPGDGFIFVFAETAP